MKLYTTKPNEKVKLIFKISSLQFMYFLYFDLLYLRYISKLMYVNVRHILVDLIQTTCKSPFINEIFFEYRLGIPGKI